MSAPTVNEQTSTAETLFFVLGRLYSTPLKRADFENTLSKMQLNTNSIERFTNNLLIDAKEDEVYLTDTGKEWFQHLGFLLKKRSFRSLMEFYHQGNEPRLVHDVILYMMTFIEKVPSLDSFWICSPWITIDSTSRPRFKKCLRKIKRIQVITRPPEKTASANIRSSVLDSLDWLLEQGVDKISLHNNVHAKVYLMEENVNSWKNRVLLIGSENFTFSSNPELSLCIHDDRLFREARARLASLITDKRFKG